MVLEDPSLDPMLITSSSSTDEEGAFFEVFAELDVARDCFEGPPERVAGM